MAALIRSIQRAEGHTDCFQKGVIDCDQVDCKWHPLCLEDPGSGRRPNIEHGKFPI